MSLFVKRIESLPQTQILSSPYLCNPIIYTFLHSKLILFYLTEFFCMQLLFVFLFKNNSFSKKWKRFLPYCGSTAPLNRLFVSGPIRFDSYGQRTDFQLEVLQLLEEHGVVKVIFHVWSFKNVYFVSEIMFICKDIFSGHG